MSVRLPAAARREQLLTAALGVFAGRGFDGASMNDVADAAGVTKPVVYQHFTSKRELYLALLDDVGQRLRASIVAATATTDDPHEQAERGFGAWFGWVATEPDGFRLLFGSGSRRDREFAATVRSVEDTVADAVMSLIRADDIDADQRRYLAWGLVGMAEATARRLVADGLTFDANRLAAQMADLAWGGLRSIRPR
jgi:AcrR family transcriptional regulator